MNNSKFAVENSHLSDKPEADRTPQLREMEGELVAVITAIETVMKSEEWSTLKTKVFGAIAEGLVKEIQSEARKENPDTNKLNRLSGELKWAERYANLDVLRQVKRTELTHIRTKLYGTTQENS